MAVSLKLYAFVCVACICNWIAMAYQPIQNLFKNKLNPSLSKNRVTRSISGLINAWIGSDAHGKTTSKSNYNIRTNSSFASLFDADFSKMQEYTAISTDESDKEKLIQMPAHDSFIVAGFMEFDPKLGARSLHKDIFGSRRSSANNWFKY